MNNPIVIAVSGVSGAGKTTIVKLLASEFDCPYLLFDDYTDKGAYPNNMKNWLIEGADLSLIQTPRFQIALKSLISTSHRRFVFVEEPFGKEREEMSLLIDNVILLDQPMELCLSRIIKRHADRSHVDAISSISNYLEKYEDHFREIYLTTACQVRSNADLVVNKIASINDTTRLISDWLEEKCFTEQ
jgi:uridine kinase